MKIFPWSLWYGNFLIEVAFLTYVCDFVNNNVTENRFKNFRGRKSKQESK